MNSIRAGVFKSVDGGQSWFRSERGLVNPRGVEPYTLAFCQSRSAPEVAYLFTNQYGISRTSDFGDSFEPLVWPPNPELGDCAVDPSDPDVVYALGDFDPKVPAVLFKSTDGGRSFSEVGVGLENVDAPAGVTVAPANPQIVYVLNADAQGGLYVSSDGGLNFQPLPNAPASLSFFLHPTQDGTLLLFGSVGPLYLSSDGGDSFTQVGAGLPGRGALAFDPSDPLVLYVAVGLQGLFRSTDGGLTFERVQGLGDPQLRGRGVLGLGLSPGDAQNPPRLYVTTGLGPLRSDDGGNTFVPIHNGFRAAQVQDLSIDIAGRILVATFNSLGLFRSTALGEYEVISDVLPQETVVTLNAVAAAPDDADTYLVAGAYSQPGYGGIFRTTDGGRSWSPALVSPRLQASRLRMAYAPSDSSRVYVATVLLLRSDDGGQSFTVLALRGLGSVAVDPVNPDLVYVGSWGGGNGIYRSTDGGNTFEQLSLAGDVSAILLDPKRPEVIYAGLRAGRVLRSLDGAQTFALADLGLTGDAVLGMAMDRTTPTRLFVWMHGGGLFRTDDGADTWIALDTEETLRRSGAEAGQTAIVIEPGPPTRVDLGWGSVLQVVNPD